MAGGHNEVKYCSGSHLKESRFLTRVILFVLLRQLDQHQGAYGYSCCRTFENFSALFLKSHRRLVDQNSRPP